MRILDDIASKWHRTGGSWMPAAWPIGGPEIGDPVLAVGTPATALRWMPYPKPRPEVVAQAVAYVAQAAQKSELAKRFPDWRSDFPASYSERRAALLLAIRRTPELREIANVV